MSVPRYGPVPFPEERVAGVLVQEECRMRPMLGRLREQKALEEQIEGSGGMRPGSDHFCRLESTGTGQSIGFFCKTRAVLERKRPKKL